MSNTLSIRRVLVQTLHEDGTPDGPPTYGVMAADRSATSFNSPCATLTRAH